MSGNLTRKQQVQKTEEYIRKKFRNDSTGHDWWHIFRVRNMALQIAEKEGGNRFLIEMSALLHDLEDWKLNDKTNLSKTKKWLHKIRVSEIHTSKVLQIIEQVSFKGAGVENIATSIEAKIVQDADRLDAIGAIGIARAFNYGGFKNRPLYNPELKPRLNMSKEEYKRGDSPTINHFYEKLLLLKDKMNTETGKRMAKERHQFMESFLDKFYKEWEGEA